MKRFLIAFVLWHILLVQITESQSEPVTTGSLIREMIDLHQLGDFPDPAYKTVQFSSYDHRSQHPGGPGWFANSDGFGGEPIPNFERVITKPNAEGIGEYLICDVTGPGAIVRVWTAAIQGDIRMYLDGNRKPVFSGSAEDFFLRTYKPYLSKAQLDESLFEGSFSQRNAGYYPIPFAKRCRIVWIGKIKEIHFYQVQIREYKHSAKVITFTPNDLQTYRQDIINTARCLHDPEGTWRYHSSEEPSDLSAVIPPGENKEVFFYKGTKAIECLAFRVHAREPEKALRQTILQIHFDEYPWGQVQSPLGDFFGAAPGINPYDSIPFTVKPTGEMICRFVMPFQQSVRIMLENMGDQPVVVSVSVLLTDYDWQGDSSMHFRARWRVDHGLLASNAEVMDMPYLVANGKGVYVGTAAILLNPNDIPSSYGNWWGEGDEKIFVDEDIRPSTFGTGSEDYFNYAWSSGDIFLHPYIGQPRNDGPANRGFVTNNRWHILDNLPFQYRLSFYMELFSHEPTPGVSYARLSYHYARPGLMDDHLPITSEDVRHLTLPDNWEPASAMGASNSIFFPAELTVKPNAMVEFVYDPLWQGGTLMVWRPEKEGDTLSFTLPLEKEGSFVVKLAAARTPRSGKISVLMDGAPLDFAGVIDLFEPDRTLLRPVESKKVELKKGDHVLTIRYEGKNPDSQENEIGLDFIWLQE